MSLDAPNQYANENSSKSAALRRRKVFFIYVIFGPPIGAIIVVFTVLVVTMYDGGIDLTYGSWIELIQALSWFLMITLFALMYSYLVGGVQAALTGVIVACLSSNNGRFGYGLALAAPALVGLVAGIVLAYPLNTGAQLSAYLGVIGVLANLAIRFLFRKRFRREDFDHIAASAQSHETNTAI